MNVASNVAFPHAGSDAQVDVRVTIHDKTPHDPPMAAISLGGPTGAGLYFWRLQDIAGMIEGLQRAYLQLEDAQAPKDRPIGQHRPVGHDDDGRPFDCAVDGERWPCREAAPLAWSTPLPTDPCFVHDKVEADCANCKALAS